MKLFNKKAGNRVININGTNVKFTNCIATVDDAFGEEALKLGLPDLYEDGKQPLFETPKEIQMKTDFQDKEDWYQKEIVRLTTARDSYKRRVEELEVEVRNWKAEYEKERELRIKEVEGSAAESAAGTAPAEEASETVVEENSAPTKTEEVDEEALKRELMAMRKEELLQFAEEAGIDKATLEGKTKVEIIQAIISPEK